MRFFYYFILILLFSCSPTKKGNKNLIKDTAVITKNAYGVDTDEQQHTFFFFSDPGLKGEKPSRSMMQKPPVEESESVNNQPKNSENYVNQNTHTPSPSSTAPSSFDGSIIMGKLVYKIPDTMIVKKIYNIRIRIIRDTSNKIIYNDLNETKEYVIKTTRLMEVKIVDPSPESDKNFEIVKSNKDIQLVESSEHTEWVYDVTPLKSGNLKLNIVISIIDNGYNKEIVYFDTVYVKANPKRSIVDFIKENWQWLISTIIIPLIIWWYNKKNNKDKKN
jgi:hypothetical protein